MQDQRQRFRFRLPWPTGPSSAAPRAGTLQPPPQTQATAQPAQAPAQRPPFRPAGIAPIQPAPPPRPEGRTSSPSPAVSRTRSASPSPKTNATQAVSAPSSSKGATSSQPPSKAQPASLESNKPLPENPQPRLESSSQTAVGSETNLPQQPAEAAAPTKPLTSQKLDNGHINIDHSRVLSESKEEVVNVSVKEEKTEYEAYEQSIQKRITQLLTAAPTKELHTVSFQAEQKHETVDSINMVASDSSNTKPVNTHTEPHQDSVISNDDQPQVHKEVSNDVSEFVHKVAPGHVKDPINEKPVSIVTLAGDNRGASMQLSSDSTKKEGSVHIHRGYKAQPDESPETTTDSEESFNGRSKDRTTKEEEAMKAYVNNNVQSINNSIVFDCIVTERNPGVELVISQSQAQPDKSNQQTSKVEFRVTPADKLTYQPTIRRRCLRGLFMEPSDSEADNPEKPRRHGCRYSCGEKSNDKDIGIF